MTSATLYGYGRLPWERARALLDGCHCTWTDLGGLHITEAPPDALPVGATHLWGWAANGTSRYVRLRFDMEAAYPAVLSDEPETTRGAEAVLAEPVTPTRRPALLWGPDDRQAGPLPQAILDRAWELIEVPGTAPVTFVRARP